MFKVNNKDTRTTQSRRSDLFIVNFEHISHLVLVFSIANFEHIIAGWDVRSIYVWRPGGYESLNKYI